jgi:hypothetical protein
VTTKAKREPRAITLSDIKDDFLVDEASYWFGNKWCPSVRRRDEGGYAIRVVKSMTVSGSRKSFTFDYFYLDNDGLITVAPRGYARDYKPGRVVDIEAAVEQYATPRPDAQRIGGAW